MTIAQLSSGNLLAARRIARSLGTTEETVDSSILAQADLLGAIVAGRRDAGASIETGHAALKKAVAALDAMTRARDLLVDCHADLAEVRDRFRLRAEDVGCTADKASIMTGRSRAA